MKIESIEGEIANRRVTSRLGVADVALDRKINIDTQWVQEFFAAPIEHLFSGDSVHAIGVIQSWLYSFQLIRSIENRRRGMAKYGIFPDGPRPAADRSVVTKLQHSIHVSVVFAG